MKNPLLCSLSIGCGFSLAKALDRAVAAGFSQVDLLLIHGWKHFSLAELVAPDHKLLTGLETSLAERNLGVGALNCGLPTDLGQKGAQAREMRRREIGQVAYLMHGWQVPVTVFQPPLRWEGSWEDAEVEACLDEVASLHEAAQTEGVCLALEPHLASPFDTLPRLQTLQERLPELPLAYDPTHYIAKGYETVQTLGMLGNAAIVNLRDAAPGSLQMPFGQGCVDFPLIFQALRDYRYQGPISVEFLGEEDVAFDVVASSVGLRKKIISA